LAFDDVRATLASTPFLIQELKQTEVPERLLDCRNLLRRARILAGCGARRRNPEQLSAMRNPGALRHEAVLARHPFLNLLIGGAWTS